MTVFLEPVTGKGLKIPMDKAIIFIGRHPDCDVVITRSRMISRKHCALVQIDKSLVIRDLGSTNGVKVNGERVPKEAHFTPGDTITIGDIDYLVQLGEDAPSRSGEPNRDHPQDAREAGSPSRCDSVARPRADPQEYSQEIPVAIPDEESRKCSSEIESDTPDSPSSRSPQRRPDEGAGRDDHAELAPGGSARLPRRDFRQRRPRSSH